MTPIFAVSVRMAKRVAIVYTVRRTTMTNDENKERFGSQNRRRLLRGVAAAGGTGMLLSGPASASGGNGQGQGEGGGPGGGPPNSCSCPDGTFLAKYDFITDGEECDFALAEGDDVVNITNWEGKDGDKCEPVTLHYESPGYEIDAICAFGGVDTHTVSDPDGEYTSDLTNPGGQQAAISNVTFCGRPVESAECPTLTAEYQCTDYEEESGSNNHRRTATWFRIEASAPISETYSIAVANEPGDWREGLGFNSGEGTAASRAVDASVPKKALVFWTCVGDKPEGVTTWGDYKQDTDFDDLKDWYEKSGSAGFAPKKAPEDVDDDLLVVEVTDIPDGEPDEDIAADDFPNMSQEAEDKGWIACEKFDNGE